jgi:hypothetical protein
MSDRSVARVFDFDDTLATSDGFIRILHYIRGEPVNTRGWLEEMGLSGHPGPMGSIELSTEDYSRYAKIVGEMVRLGDLVVQRPEQPLKSAVTDVVDYSGVARLVSPEPIKSVMEIAREAFARGEVIGIITGRSGLDSIYDITRKKIRVANRGEIASFMAKNGVALSLEDIHCVGDLAGGVPYNKAVAMKRGFIDRYDLETVIFYDDDERNLEAVGTVDRKIRCIDSKGILESAGSNHEILEKAKVRRRSVTSWSRSLQKAGII